MVGELTISFDFEIGWGDVTNGRWRDRESRGSYDKMRVVLPELLNVLDRFQCPVTWATVGAMFDEPSNRTLDHLPPKAFNVVSDVLATSKASSFDGRDLFAMVFEREIHEIACHSYSHVPFDYEGVDDQFVRSDLSAFQTVLHRQGLTTDCLVFPENTARFWRAVADCGFTRARTSPSQKFTKRQLNLLDSLVAAPPLQSITPSPAEGLNAVAGSALFNSGVGKAHRLPFVYRRAVIGLDRAIESGGTLHLWAHPFNFAEGFGLLDAFGRFLSRAATLRDEGKLVIAAM